MKTVIKEKVYHNLRHDLKISLLYYVLQPSLETIAYITKQTSCRSRTENPFASENNHLVFVCKLEEASVQCLWLLALDLLLTQLLLGVLRRVWVET